MTGPVDTVDDAIVQAIQACEDSEILTVSGLAALAVQTAAPILLAAFAHDGPDGHCVCYHLVRKQLDELQALHADGRCTVHAWRPARSGETPGNLVPGQGERGPAPDPFGAPAGSGERAREAAEQLPTVGRWPGRLTPRPEHLAAVRAIEEVGG